MQAELSVLGIEAALAPSRYAVYRKRKRENLLTRPRRTPAQLAALESKPLAERTTEEKEAVRNHRKVLQRRERTAVTSLSVAAALPASLSAPPPTRSASPPPRDASSPAIADTSLPLSAPIRDDSMLLNTTDLEDILGRPLSPAAASSSIASAAQHVSPLHMSPSPVYDTPFNPFSSLPAAASCDTQPLPPAAAASTSAAAASAMSSGSKLKQAILKKRSAMSMIRREEDSPKQNVSSSSSSAAASAVAGKEVDEEEEKQWQIVINNKIKAMSATHLRSNQCVGYNVAHHLQRITTNVRLWVSTARAMGCTGTEDGGLHAPGGCPGRFTPAYFFDLTHFAHWKRYKRSNNGMSSTVDTVNCRARCGCVDRFRAFMTGVSAHGRVLWNVCHKVESIAQSTHSTKK